MQRSFLGRSDIGQFREALEKTVQEVIRGTVGRLEAAGVSGVCLKTNPPLCEAILGPGPVTLRDRRRGHFKKVKPEQEERIMALKREKTHRSASQSRAIKLGSC